MYNYSDCDHLVYHGLVDNVFFNSNEAGKAAARNTLDAAGTDDIAQIDERIEEDENNFSAVTEKVKGDVVPSKNLFAPSILTNLGWTYDSDTDTFEGTIMQIRYGNNWIVPVPIRGGKPYIFTALAWTDGNQGTNGEGLTVQICYADGSRDERKLMNTTSTPTRINVVSHGAESVTQNPITALKFSYGSNGENVWHLKNAMWINEYSLDPSYVPEYVPYGDIVLEGAPTAIDLVARQKYPEWMNQRYLNHIGVSKYSNVNVPCQSLADISRSRKLGFGMIELNCHKTSDGHYITIHGDNGKFGQQVVLSDGDTSIQTVSIGSVTLDYIKQNVRYISNYAQYCTSIPTLEEALYECRINGIHPYIQYVDNGMIDIADRIMGRDGYALGIYEGDRPEGFNGVCMSWLKISDIDLLIEKCNRSGGLLCCGLDVTNSAFSEYTDSDWKEVASRLHAKGYRASFAAGYSTPQLTQKLFECGFDIASSGWEIPEIANGNIYDARQTPTFDGFAHTGTVTEGVLYLPANNNIGIPSDVTIPTVYLGGASLHVRFKGTLHIGCGRYIDHDFVSDGAHEIWVSSIFEGAAPTFYAKAKNDTCEIYEIEFKSSKL